MSPPRPLAVWRIELLGGLRAVSGATVLTHFGSSRIGALLARLALEPQRLHAREELADLLWPNAEPAAARNRLRHALSTLRRLLQPPGAGDVLDARRDGVRLNPQATTCDALEFEAHARAGRIGAALAVYRGELLPGLYDEWVQQERTRLAAVFERLSAAAVTAAADPPTSLAPVVGVTLHPERQLLLPSYLSAFFGRQTERAELAALLRDRRLVTITGAGGVGKTRLAVEVARELAGRFETLVFIAAAGIGGPQDIGEAIRQALRLRPVEGPGSEQLVDFLSERDALIVLDGFEPLATSGGGATVAGLLAAAPRLRCLVTSRRLLMVEGERDYALAPLPLPAPAAPLPELAANPGVALFVDRARAARPELQVTTHNAAQLQHVVAALEGVPLAIELAAARIRALPLADMAQQIDVCRDWLARSGRHDRRDPRHASLQAAIEWSWRLLRPDLQRLLGELTVFRDGWTEAAAAAVSDSADAPALLRELVADSMVQQRTDPWGGGRFAMLEMIREFVAGRTDAAVLRAAAARHRRHFLGELRRAGRPDAARLALDRPNVEQAMATAIGDGDRDAALGIALALRPLAEVRGLGPAMIELAGRVAADATVDAAQACRLHMMLAEALSAACRLDEAVTHGRRALELAGPGLERAEAAYVVARACWERDVTAIAHKAELERSLAVAEEAGAAHLQVRVLNLLGNVAVKDEGDLDRAEARYRQAAEVAQGNGLARLAAQARFNLGIVSRKRQSFRFALRCSDEVLRNCRERGDAMMLADALHERGVLLAEMHCWQEAVDALRDCIEHCWQHRAVTTLVYALWNLARPLARAGRAEEAARLIGFAAAYWERHGGPLSAHDRRYVRRVTGLAAAWIGAPRAAALADDGARLGLAEAVHLARAAPPSGGQPGVGRDGIGAPPAAAAARGS